MRGYGAGRRRFQALHGCLGHQPSATILVPRLSGQVDAMGGRGPWERGHLARLNTYGPSAHLRAGRPRSQGERTRSREPSAGRVGRVASGETMTQAVPFLGTRASCPLEHRWAFGPLAGGTPALPGGRTRSREPSAGRVGRVASGETMTQAVPFLGTRASCPLEHLWAFGPLAGGTPALPGGRTRSRGPSAGRVGRVASGETMRQAALFLGARASCPLQHTCGPSALLRAGRPRSREHRVRDPVNPPGERWSRIRPGRGGCPGATPARGPLRRPDGPRATPRRESGFRCRSSVCGSCSIPPTRPG